MTASRELDALVAEKVMGWERWTCGDYRDKEAVLFQPNATLRTWTKCDVVVPLAEYGAVAVPFYSTDIATAWAVVEKIKADWIFTMEIDQHVTRVGFGKNYASTPIEFSVSAKTAPLAICLAALEAEARP